MARRPVTSRVNCAKPGCREVAHFEYDSQRDRAESEKCRKDYPWRCYRHSHEDEVLSAGNPVRETVLTVARPRNPRYERELEDYQRAVERRSMFAREPREFHDFMIWDGASNGLVSGPGFRAIAEDFPEGTRLVVSVRIEMPYCGDELHGADGGRCPTCGQDSHPIPDVPVDALLPDFPAVPVGPPSLPAESE